MGTLLSYSAISTKIRAMQSRLVTTEQIYEILQLPDVPQVVAYLKQTPGYSRYWSDLDETSLHRAEVERLLRQTVFLDFVRLYKFADHDQKTFLDLYAKKYDIQILKDFLTAIFDHGSSSQVDISLYLDFFSKHSRLNLERLQQCETEPALLEALKGTEYYAPLKAVQGLDPLIFDDGMALDVYYFTQIWNVRKKLFSGDDLEELTVTYGEKFDMLNLQFIHRARLLYHMSPAEIYAILIPVRYRLTQEEIRELIEAPTPEEAGKIFDRTWYGKKYRKQDAVSLEEFYNLNLMELLDREARKHPCSVAVLFRYLYSKEQEVRRLTLALEAVRYRLSPDEAIRYIR